MAQDDAHFYEPAQGHGLKHDPFNAIIAPRPIGWISSISAAGAVNLAPYSFFNAFNYFPPVIGFSSIGWKDTLANVAETREFCWNLSTMALAQEMNLTCAPAPRGTDEFEVAGLTHAPSRLIRAPRVKESPVNFECRLTQIVQIERADGVKVETWLALGEVVAVHIDRELVAGGVYETAGPHPILRCGRMGDYVEITGDTLFEMVRPGWPVE